MPTWNSFEQSLDIAAVEALSAKPCRVMPVRPHLTFPAWRAGEIFARLGVAKRVWIRRRTFPRWFFVSSGPAIGGSDAGIDWKNHESEESTKESSTHYNCRRANIHPPTASRALPNAAATWRRCDADPWTRRLSRAWNHSYSDTPRDTPPERRREIPVAKAIGIAQEWRPSAAAVNG